MTDYISRADAIEAVASITMSIHLSDVICDKLMALPSAETHEIRTETHGVCLISKDDAMGAVQDHFNANGFKGYDDGQKMMDRINALPSAELPKGDLISRADAIEAVRKMFDISNAEANRLARIQHADMWKDDILRNRAESYGYQKAMEAIEDIPSADADGEDLIIKGAKGIQDGLYNITDGKLFKYKAKGGTVRTYPIVQSADAVHIHEDGTLEVKVPNAQKVGRVLVVDTDSHIGGGLFYPANAVQGEWKNTITWQPYCSNCEYVFGEDEEFSPFWNYCPMCGAKMKGGAE